MSVPAIAIPATMRAFVLDGTGFEHASVRDVPTPRPGPGQLLGRVDAAGICSSVNKVIAQGPDHSFMYGRDLAAHPAILGDEGVITVIEVGEGVAGRFAVGARYAVQPAVDAAPVTNRAWYANGAEGVRKVALGYTLPGLLAEYVLITREAIDAGCLIPLDDATVPAAHAAIAEPISCVISAHAHHLHVEQLDPTESRHARVGLRPGGIAVVVGAGAMGRIHVDVALGSGSRAVVVADMVERRLEIVREQFAERAAARGVSLVTVNPAASDLRDVVFQLSGGAMADDVIVAAGSSRAVESAQRLVGRYGVLDLFGGLSAEDAVVGLDGRAIHYGEFNVTGSSGGGPHDLAVTVGLMVSGRIDPGLHISHVGDLAHTPDFLAMIRERANDGKAVVYPNLRLPAIVEVDRWGLTEERALTEGEWQR
jgi:threonine dehydrogenase-like Zn-dependent dehydrogenase